MSGYITLPMFEISARPFAERLADWLERVAQVTPDAGETVTKLRGELAHTLARCLAEETGIRAALAFLSTRVQPGQAIELERARCEGEASWYAGYNWKGSSYNGVRSQSVEGALLGLSSLLEAQPWIGSPNPALHYNQPPASSKK